MEKEILVEVKDLSKKFSRSLKQSMWYGLVEIANNMLGLNGNKSQLKKGEFWAVKDINFQLRRGECVGLIGHNGAGKSTLLKMLNGLIRPDEGSITIRGKVGALIELGAGFNPLLTGRENIYVNGQLIGFSKKEIEEKLEDILNFAEIGEFIDSPIQNYSSGMKVRLGFAIAAQMEPDVLIIDEVLAVGDLSFRVKCINKINELLEKTAVIFVSHNMPQVYKVSTSILLMSKGQVLFHGNEIEKGVEQYYAMSSKEVFLRVGQDLMLTSFIVNGNEVQVGGSCNLVYLDDLVLAFSFSDEEAGLFNKIVLRFVDKSLNNIATAQSTLKNSGKFSVRIPRAQLGAGQYYINAFFIKVDETGRENIIANYNSMLVLESLNSKIENHSPIQFFVEIIE
jgi:lipopolysaccharide transport system ATP-binding protein